MSRLYLFFIALGFAFFLFGVWHLAAHPTPEEFRVWNRAAWGFLTCWLPVVGLLYWHDWHCQRAERAALRGRTPKRPRRLLK